MADVKTFNSAAVSYTATVPEVQIVATPTQNNIVLPSNLGDVELSVSTQNLGEENVPDPAKYQRNIDRATINVGEINLTLIKQLGSTEILTTSELASRIVGKNILDTSYTSEIFTKSFETVFSDVVDATDDFYGLANIDDDQIASVGKVAADYLTGTIDVASYNVEKSINDLLYASETSTKSVEKVFATPLTVSEQAVTVTNFIRQFQETQTVTEQISRVLAKTFLDNITKVDLVSKVLELAKIDQANISELFARTVIYNREFIDSVDATDDFYGLANIDDDQIASFNKVVNTFTNLANSDQFSSTVNFIRFFNNVASASEAASLNIETPYFDSASFSELDTKLIAQVTHIQTTINEQDSKTLSKVLEDLFNTTDDFLGNANIDDDQIAFIGKVLNSNLSGISEYNANELYKVFNTTSTLQELAEVSIDKILAHTTTITQEYTQLLNKVLASNLNSTIDVDNKDYTKLLFDQNTSTLDEPYFIVDKSPVDNVSITETYKFFTISKEFVDQVTTIDTQTYLNQTLWDAFDQADATDDFYGLANIDDDQIATFDKVLASSTSGVSDFSNRQIQPNKVDNVATTESRSAHIQDYFSQEYVDYTQRYVGTTVTI